MTEDSNEPMSLIDMQDVTADRDEASQVLSPKAQDFGEYACRVSVQEIVRRAHTTMPELPKRIMITLRLKPFLRIHRDGTEEAVTNASSVFLRISPDKWVLCPTGEYEEGGRERYRSLPFGHPDTSIGMKEDKPYYHYCKLVDLTNATNAKEVVDMITTCSLVVGLGKKFVSSSSGEVKFAASEQQKAENPNAMTEEELLVWDYKPVNYMRYIKRLYEGV